MRCVWMCVLLSCWGTVLAGQATVHVDPVPVATLTDRLHRFGGNDRTREETLKAMFSEAGCAPAQVHEVKAGRLRQPNVECVLPGTGDRTIVVGAHFDHAEVGEGVVSNWAAAALLPSLLQGLARGPRTHTYRFVGFTGEGHGVLGAEAYVDAMPREQVAKVDAMVHLNLLGLGPTLVWVSQSDPALVRLLAQVSSLTGLPVARMDLDGIAPGDEELFVAKHVCTLTLHSLTPDGERQFQTVKDNVGLVRGNDYARTYSLALMFLAELDVAEVPRHACTVQAVPLYRLGYLPGRIRR